MKTITSLVALVLIPAAVMAGEFTYSARVISHEPVVVRQTTTTPEDHCFAAKPRGFEAQLSWDIDCSRPRTVEVTRYQVSYAVDNRTFTTTLGQMPGDYIPVRVQFF